jgi:uncharacterized protein (DUF305 family)
MPTCALVVTTLDVQPTVDEGPPIPWRTIVACFATAVLGLGLGVLLSRRQTPAATSVDVRFLQDMRLHHEQAVGMSLMLLDKPVATSDATVRSIAREVLQSQAFAGGRMAEMLTSFHAAVANEGDIAMEWMAMPVPLGEMPGMATDDDTAELAATTGRDAAKVYVRLMITHHQGGVHMADYATTHAGTATVRSFAASIVNGQRSEINELQAIAAKL